MKIRKLLIERFRGIQHLDWNPTHNIICLVGPGDSTKSTILDAIEFVLSPKWNIPFDDTDFYNADTSQPIEIKVTVGELPNSFLKDTKFGLSLQGWGEDGTLHDEPEDADEKVLTIRLQVDSSLEPTWEVISDRDIEGKHISARDRELFCLARLGAALDKHLSWGRGSVLTRLTGEVKEAPALFANVIREARKGLQPAALTSLAKVVTTAQTQAGQMGVRCSSGGYVARLDLQAQHIGMGCLTLHDGEVPLRNAGFGSRRLLAIALQRESTQSGGITLVDEVEHGLEPHRIRHLLKHLIEGKSFEANNAHIASKTSSQIVMTTHSPTAIVSLSAENIHITRSKDGNTSITPVPMSLQGIVRKVPDAFLARKILVCEGETEVGFSCSLDNFWTEKGHDSFAYLGIVALTGRSGGGSDTPEIAQSLNELGYDVCLLVDSDQNTSLKPSVETLRGKGVTVIQWDGCCSIEERIFQDLPLNGVNELLELAFSIKTPEAIRQAVQSRLEGAIVLPNDVTAWFTCKSEAELRNAIGKAASHQDKGWFKRQGYGQDFGAIICKYLGQFLETDTEKKIEKLKEWVFKNDNSASSS